MPRFKDGKDREWSLQIDLRSVRRIKDEGKEFYSLVENKFTKYLDLGQRDDLVLEWVYAFIRPEAESKGVSIDDFLDGMAGDHILEARQAFAKAFSDFFPDQATRSALEKAENLQRQFQADVAKEVEKGQENLLAAARKQLRKAAAEDLSEEAMERILNPAFAKLKLTNLNEISVASAGS